MKLLSPLLLSTALLLSLGACSTQPPAPAPDNSSQLSADWRERTKPMFNLGPSAGGSTRWEVPPILDRGYYRVVERRGDGAEVIDGQRVHIDGSVNKKIFLMLPMGYSRAELLDEKYIVDPKLKADRRG